MREVLFRAMRTDNGEWVESTIAKEKDGKTILLCCEKIGSWLNMRWVTVLRDTVSAFTGYTDKAGNKVFELDILQHCKHPDWRGVAVWDASREAFQVTVFIPDGTELPTGFTYMPEEWEVIGNIHDNPELLEVNA